MKWYWLTSLLAGSVFAYQGGALKNHGHTSAAGDGGQLSTISLSSMSITGNQFYVGGSTFSVRAGRVGIGTNNPNVDMQLVDSIGQNPRFGFSRGGSLKIFEQDIAGGSSNSVWRLLQRNSDRTGGLVRMQMNEDGGLTMPSGYLATAVSSATQIPPISTTQTIYATAFATVTLTMNAVPYKVCFSGSLSGTVGDVSGWNVLVDSGFVDGLSAVIGVTSLQFADNQYATNFSACRPFPALSAGSHSFGFTVKTPSGNTITYPDGDASANVAGRFWVEEIH